METKSELTLIDMVGKTPLFKVRSLSELTQCEIFVKCEHLNPGGSIKDRAAKQMLLDAIERGDLKPGMQVVEGTAGNTGIGLAWLATTLGYGAKIVMPKGQTPEKQRMLELYGADLKLVDPVPFKDPNHFFHQARQIAEDEPEKYWWANQFDNLSNCKAHYENTGPEIFEQMGMKVDALVSVAGSGGTIAGTSLFLKEQSAETHIRLIDPEGSGLASYFRTGEFKSQGSSITEGIGIMRLVDNFAQAQVDEVTTLPDQELVDLAYKLRRQEGLVCGLSSALNLAGAVQTAKELGPGARIVTFLCDLGERSASKLYNPQFLEEKGLRVPLNL